MSTPATVLVLTPSLGGDFFGDILTGLAREVVGADGRIVVVETLQEDAPRDEVGAPGTFSTRTGWEVADGVVSITTAVGASYLRALRAAGKPIVLLSSTQMGGFDAPMVRPDNMDGARGAVEHLLGHGHERIGFVGNLAQRDIAERFEAYREVLAERGLDHDASLLFEASDNGEAGGAAAAHKVMAAKKRPTALMVATDRNALGLIAEFAAAGISVPGDIAVVGYDSIASGAFASPPLTSVDPRFDEVGSLAGRLVVGAIAGTEAAAEVFTPDAAVLHVRETCGCAAVERRSVALGADAQGRAGTEYAHEQLEAVLLREWRTGDDQMDAEIRKSAAAIASEAISLLERGDDATTAEIDDFAGRLLRNTSRPRTLRRFAAALTDYARAVASVDSDTSEAFGGLPPQLAIGLWKAQSGAFLREAEATDIAVAEQYAVDAGLLDTIGADPRDLAWIVGTHVKGAALALWVDDKSSGRLEVVGKYDPAGVMPGLLDTVIASEAFPPRGLVDSASALAREVCVVVPVSTRDRDWGLLAVVAEIDPTTARETYQHWAALLCAALESQRRQEEIKRSALFDTLTGLPNRQLFVQQVDQALARWKRSSTPFSVLFLDLDGFKLINDSLGHQMGDRVLQAVGKQIKSVLREMDTAARFGGDEFVILLSDTDASNAVVAARRVQSTLAAVHEFDGHEIVTRASIGVASSDIEYFSAEEVLRDADAAMYRAKAAEPGSIAFFDAPMHEGAVRRAMLARDVLRGLQDNQFEVHYQPIVNLNTGRTDRFEALVRWRHPLKGLIEPAEFLDDLADTSLIVQLGHWVLNEVCRQIAQWQPNVANVSINVSDKEFWSQDLLTYVLATLERHQLPPDVLTLEVTEAVLMRRPEMALRIMQKLHDAGLRLHIDDFGTGFSSLETLHRFPVEAFKIDRSFIQTLTDAENSAELISSLVQLGNALGLAVVAEGVETDEQLAFLQSLGCAAGQGYLFKAAVTAADAAALLGKPVRDVSTKTTS
jgi:diguanylate cyclase (GGDEF)-like protein